MSVSKLPLPPPPPPLVSRPPLPSHTITSRSGYVDKAVTRTLGESVVSAQRKREYTKEKEGEGERSSILHRRATSPSVRILKQTRRQQDVTPKDGEATRPSQSDMRLVIEEQKMQINEMRQQLFLRRQKQLEERQKNMEEREKQQQQQR